MRVYLGHYAVAFAAKRAAPKTSLGTLLAAALFVDLLWPVFLLLGWERVAIDPGNTAFTPLAFVSYPISHSLATVAGWALLFGALVWARTRYRAGALACAALVASHWLLDAIAHRPDLPLWPGGSTLVGAGLWNSVPGTFAVEGALFAAGLAIYLRATRAADAIGAWALWTFVTLNLAIYVGNAFGPLPDPAALAWVALGVWLFPFWAGWFERHRSYEIEKA